MAGLIEDLYEELIKSTKYNIFVLSAIFQFLQQRESEKTPDAWAPYYALVNDQNTAQILGHNPHRASLTIVNNGPGVALISNRQFDAAAMRAIVNGQLVGVVAQIYRIPPSQTVTIGSRGGAYACALTTTSPDLVSVYG